MMLYLPEKAVKSSANILSLVSLPPIETPFIVLSLRICIANISITRPNKYAEKGVALSHTFFNLKTPLVNPIFMIQLLK